MTISLGDRWWLARRPGACEYCGAMPDEAGNIVHLLQCRVTHAALIARKSGGRYQRQTDSSRVD